MKFKFDGVENYQANSWFFSWKFERTQDVEIRSILSFPIKADERRFDHINQTFNIDHLPEEVNKSDSNKNKSFWLEDYMVSKGSEDEIDENESQQEISPRLKQKENREKLRSYYMVCKK